MVRVRSFRILGGLWPVYGGTVKKPSTSDSLTSLNALTSRSARCETRSSTPTPPKKCVARRKTDEDLLDILRVLQIEHIVSRKEDGVQRAMARRPIRWRQATYRIGSTLYHKPKYAILDECTSAVTLEIEKVMYDHATELGITMLTVSHRPSLWKYHSYVLQYDGQGGYVLHELDAEKRLALQEEKQALEQKLLLVPKWQERLDALKEARRKESIPGATLGQLEGEFASSGEDAAFEGVLSDSLLSFLSEVDCNDKPYRT